jgi:hypothetical protein
MIVPIIVCIIGIFLLYGYIFYSILTSSPALMLFNVMATLSLLSRLTVLVLILTFIFAIFGVIAIGNMIRTGNFSKIFAFRENWQLIQRIGLGNYILWLVVMFVIGLIAVAIGSAIHWVVELILWALLFVFYGKSLALVMNEAMGTS